MVETTGAMGSSPIPPVAPKRSLGRSPRAQRKTVGRLNSLARTHLTIAGAVLRDVARDLGITPRRFACLLQGRRKIGEDELRNLAMRLGHTKKALTDADLTPAQIQHALRRLHAASTTNIPDA